MPLKGFKYPDGEILSIEELSRESVDVSRMGVSIPTLLHMSQQRPVDRKPSTTELLSGTCQSFLERKEDFYIYPQDNAFALAGTLHHLKLEDSSKSHDRLMSEITVESMGITGTIDLYDKETRTLVDYKFSGSYKIAQCLGMTFRKINHPTEVYKRNGRWGKAGSPKRIKQFYVDESLIDFGDWGWQVNFYRYLLESNGYPVEKMFVQATVRDGSLQIARERGLDRNIYMIDIPFIHNDHLIEKFSSQRDALLKALENNELPEVCTKEERWGGNKCQSYCSVREICPYNNKGEE